MAIEMTLDDIISSKENEKEKTDKPKEKRAYKERKTKDITTEEMSTHLSSCWNFFAYVVKSPVEFEDKDFDKDSKLICDYVNKYEVAKRYYQIFAVVFVIPSFIAKYKSMMDIKRQSEMVQTNVKTN